MSDFGNQPKPMLKIQGGVMTNVLAMPVPFLSKLSGHSSGTRFHRALVWLTRFRGQLLVMNRFPPFGSIHIDVMIPIDLRFAERDPIRKRRFQVFGVHLQVNDG